MNLFLQDLIYIRLDEYKSSSNSDLKTKEDEEIQIFIAKAESRLKQIIQFEWETPIEIKQAVVILTDCLYIESLKVVKDKEIIEEKDENHTRKYQIMKKQDCMWWEVWDLIKPYLKTQKSVSWAKFYRT